MAQKSEMNPVAAKSTEFLDAAKSTFHLPRTRKLVGYKTQARRPLQPATKKPGIEWKRKPQDGLPDTWLPDCIDGLDVPAGLQLMGHNKGLYLHSLKTFVATRHSVIDEIRHLLKARDGVKALREADKLKSQAAYLGATNLQLAAGQLEDILHGKHQEPTELEAALNNVSRHLVCMLASVRLALSTCHLAISLENR